MDESSNLVPSLPLKSINKNTKFYNHIWEFTCIKPGFKPIRYRDKHLYNIFLELQKLWFSRFGLQKCTSENFLLFYEVKCLSQTLKQWIVSLNLHVKWLTKVQQHHIKSASKSSEPTQYLTYLVLTVM